MSTVGQDQGLSRRIGEVLEKHYPGHLWAVDFAGGMVNVHNLSLHGTWGYRVKQTDAFSVEDNLAHLDYAKYQPGEQTETALNKCPTCVIIYAGPTAPEPRQPAKKTAAAKT